MTDDSDGGAPELPFCRSQTRSRSGNLCVVELRQFRHRPSGVGKVTLSVAAGLMLLITACSSSHHVSAPTPSTLSARVTTPPLSTPSTTRPSPVGTECLAAHVREAPILGALEFVAGPFINHPASGTVVIEDTSGRKCRTIAVGRDGGFSTSLPPGTYLITGHSPSMLGAPNNPRHDPTKDKCFPQQHTTDRLGVVTIPPWPADALEDIPLTIICGFD